MYIGEHKHSTNYKFATPKYYEVQVHAPRWYYITVHMQWSHSESDPIHGLAADVRVQLTPIVAAWFILFLFH